MKKIFFIAIMLCTSMFAMAQPGHEKDEKVKALYIAFITQQISLTSAEAQAFWPIHAQYEAEMQNINASLPELERQQQALNIKKKYQDRFQKVIGADRTNSFFVHDSAFKQRMIDRLRQMRQNDGRNRKAPPPGLRN